jgi:hypothetical protein
VLLLLRSGAYAAAATRTSPSTVGGRSSGTPDSRTGAGNSAAMTLDVYSGLFEDDLDGVAERLNVAVAADKYPLSTRERRAEVIELRSGL